MRSITLVLLAVSTCCLGGLGAPVSAQEAPRPGLDSPKLRVAVADFQAIGGDPARATQLSDAVRRAVSAHPQVEVVGGPEVLRAVTDARAEILASRPDAARKIGDRFGVDAIVFGRIITDLSGMTDDPLAVPVPLGQIVVAETLTLAGQLHPGVAAPLGPGVDAAAELAAHAMSLLPAIGRVLSIIDSPEGVSIQLFPVGGRVLATASEYGVYDPVQFRVPGEDPSGLSSALARQDLRVGRLTGCVRTAAEADGHAIEATSIDPDGRIAVGQLVGLAPVPGMKRPELPLPALVVNSQPGQAVVTVNGRVAGITPVAVALEAGESTVAELSLRDHSAGAYEITAAQDEALAMAVALKEIPPFGELVVRTEPSGAKVSLDGREIGETPLAAKDVASGDHQLSVKLPGHKAVTRSVTIRRQRSTEVEVALEKDLRPVRIISVPEGARVALDGEQVGSTPLDLASVATGARELRLTLPGHAVLTEPVTVESTDELQVFSFRLRPLAGNVRVETTPPGATVTLDGEERGKSPLALTGLPIGQHTVSIELDGFLPVKRAIQVEDQQTAVVQEGLTRAEGQLICISVPAGARIILDGRDQGVTPRTLTGVPVGKRQVTLELEGYQPWSGRAPVIHGQTTKVEVGLIRINP